MRQILIDAMELKKSLPKFILEEAEAYIDETEEIEAIPIEWIKKKSLEFLMNRNFRWATDFQEVIDMWKVENNIPLFDDEFKITLEKENETNRQG